jgi:hypothetical protein
MSRSPRGPLSPVELTALRRVANGLAGSVLPNHRDLLILMGLAGLAPNGDVVLTEAGKQRLAEEQGRRLSVVERRPSE